MAAKETRNEPKQIIEAVPEELEKVEQIVKEVETEEMTEQEKTRRLTELERRAKQEKESLAAWVPKTELGKDVRSGKIKNIDTVLEKHKKILEAEIVSSLLPLESDLLSIGQAKGKFGGGKRRAWRQTQKKTMEGNVVTFSCMAIVGDRNGHVGLGFGEGRETLPSRAKALRKAKLNIMKVSRGFESPENEKNKDDPHTVPYIIEGKCGSVRLTLIPAPRGTGLVVADECKKILKLAGIKDVYSKTMGQTRTTLNLAQACIDALRKTSKMELNE